MAGWLSRMHGDDLAPERTALSALALLGFRPERNVRALPGTPDLVLRRRRVAVFVHGCFWHVCPRHYTRPKSNLAFWRAKAGRNTRRDARARRALNRMGWSVLVLWEHDTRKGADHVRGLLRSRLSRLAGTSAARRAR